MEREGGVGETERGKSENKTNEGKEKGSKEEVGGKVKILT